MAWEERELVPYEASTFTARAALVLAPHADDETFGCGAAIASLAAARISVTVAVVTDGAGDEKDAEARRRTGEKRLGEARAALAALAGAHPVDLESLGFPDRGVPAQLDDLADRLSELFRRLAPDLLFVPSPAEIHPDHRAVARAAEKALAALPPDARLAYYEVSQPIRPNLLLDATPYRDAKDRAMEAFASQNGARDYASVVRALNVYRKLTLPPAVLAAEAFYVVAAVELLDAARRASHHRALGPAVDPAPPRRRLFGF